MFAVAKAAREKGFDPETFVEIKAAPDLAARVEGIMGVDGLADMIRKRMTNKPRRELAFDIVKAICTDEKFNGMDVMSRVLLATRTGLAVATEGILVAPTEGLQSIELHKNNDGTDYLAVIYAGPIRGAGGSDAALSVAFADCARRHFNIGNYKPTETEIARTIEEMMLYHTRCARLQYLPSEDDMRAILQNCQICVDGVQTDEIEVSVHRNIKRLDKDGKEQVLTNRVRGGVALVICEGIAQKAKSVLKYAKGAGLDWIWLNNIIKVDKGTMHIKTAKEEKKIAVFLQELVAGRPVLAYPDHAGSFRLRYGRSRLTGIAAKGFSPATMWLLEEFIAVGTQIKMDKPGKGCIASPVDTIEGPFVKLVTGEALRVNTVEQAKAVFPSVSKILSVGDILITYGDFKKTNTPLQPTSYVEEYWEEQLRAAGFRGEIPKRPTFKEAYELSKGYNVPMHPLYIYDYGDISSGELLSIAKAVVTGQLNGGDNLFSIAELEIKTNKELTGAIERMCIPHFDEGDVITFKDDNAQSLIASLGFTRNEKVERSSYTLERFDLNLSPLQMLNIVSPFKIMRRASRIGARIGRPEKAKERLMKPAPHVLFPISDYGTKERNIARAYSDDKRKFGMQFIDIDVARARCIKGGELITTMYCPAHKSRANIEKICRSCGRVNQGDVCIVCKGKAVGDEIRKVNLAELMDAAMANISVQSAPKLIKGVKGLVSRDKVTEPLEKGILRSQHGVFIFKDGTSRFDATDAPMTHFYPKEIGVPVHKLIELGYDKDYKGEPLTKDDQLVELKHQDVILNRNGAEYFLRVSQFVDELLFRYYSLEPFYNLKAQDDLVGQSVITLSPHTSCGVLGRIIGFTNASVGFAHPYTICARRRNCDGDEDTTMLLLDALVNFSKKYLPVTIGGTMDAPIVMSVHILPEEVDDEVHSMETVVSYGKDFYDKTMSYPAPGEVTVELVGNRLGKESSFNNINFTHGDSIRNIVDAPMRSMYTKLKTMQEKLDCQFKLMDRLYTVDKQDTARRLIMSHFIPDLMGNLHSFSRQMVRCVNCNAKYRRVPLTGKCKRCKGKLVLTISKGGIEKYMNIAMDLAEKYQLEDYMKQRLQLLKDEIEAVFGGVGGGNRSVKQFNLSNFV